MKTRISCLVAGLNLFVAGIGLAQSPPEQKPVMAYRLQMQKISNLNDFPTEGPDTTPMLDFQEMEKVTRNAISKSGYIPLGQLGDTPHDTLTVSIHRHFNAPGSAINSILYLSLKLVHKPSADHQEYFFSNDGAVITCSDSDPALCREKNIREFRPKASDYIARFLLKTKLGFSAQKNQERFQDLLNHVKEEDPSPSQNTALQALEKLDKDFQKSLDHLKKNK